MRFNIHIEKAKRTELEKQIEEQEARDAEYRRQNEASLMRKTKLAQAQNDNLKKQAEIQAQKNMERDIRMREKDNLQTSLVSKK